MSVIFTSKSLRITLILLVVAIFLGIILYSITTEPTLKTQQPAPSSTLPIKIISPLQKTTISETGKQEVEKLPGISQPQILPDGSIKYELPADVPQRPNEIITKNNIVVFERIDIPEDPNKNGYITISDYISKYGQPEKSTTGSKFFGPFASTYIYNSKGFAFIGNLNTNEIFEIQVFSPTSVDNYIKTYGQDIKESRPSPETPVGS